MVLISLGWNIAVVEVGGKTALLRLVGSTHALDPSWLVNWLIRHERRVAFGCVSSSLPPDLGQTVDLSQLAILDSCK